MEARRCTSHTALGQSAWCSGRRGGTYFDADFKSTQSVYRLLPPYGNEVEDCHREGQFPKRLGESTRMTGCSALTMQYAVHSHPRLHDKVLSQNQIDNAIIALEPREGEDTLRTEDILRVLDDHKDEVGVLSV